MTKLYICDWQSVTTCPELIKWALSKKYGMSSQWRQQVNRKISPSCLWSQLDMELNVLQMLDAATLWCIKFVDFVALGWDCCRFWWWNFWFCCAVQLIRDCLPILCQLDHVSSIHETVSIWVGILKSNTIGWPICSLENTLWAWCADNQMLEITPIQLWKDFSFDNVIHID